MSLSRGEFEAQYASSSNVTPEWLRRYGRFAIPCECGDGSCLGWQMCHEVAREVQEYILELELEAALNTVNRRGKRP